MNIVNFTPFSAFVGGAIIGFAVVLFFIGNGRLAGVWYSEQFSYIKNQQDR